MSFVVAIKGQIKKYEWNLGGFIPVSLIKLDSGSVDIIEYIQADGDELSFILNKFANIPKLTLDHESPMAAPRGYVMTWHGDIAKFIVSNLN